ncbi:efflux RND transporter permease subunit [Borreliella garinii]|uniref:efflux RND transporter permease subunit n=3 Tax=Borreliella garinii TaxID=29519 RepID=UPI00018E266B|nr:efflux RND transporter permease subunit [Borreliella garinii]EED29583.1 acriflavine resistance protein [Borreliella garinii Far04]WNZ66378.1 efflux RND transporter permease subunit [Borreliella garinii]WNZ69371.1 efflux RND transporter permease subunit [Borreliella garinii]WNZ70371.1 efflux RND transporter permease subunit [Borreliella garinii]
MLVKRIVGKPITMLILFSLLMMISLYTFSRLKVDLLPGIDIPQISIHTAYPGASPREVEESVSRVLESGLSSVKNLKNIYSTSSKESSTVSLEFYHGTDLDLVLNEIRDALELVKSLLPSKSQAPRIFRYNLKNIPVMEITINSVRPVSELKRYADEVIKPGLERLDGVAIVTVNGGSRKRVLIEVSQNRLESYGLSLSRISSIIASQNLELSAGNIIENNLEYLVQVSGKFKSIEEIGNVVIAYKIPDISSGINSSAIEIKLKDIANIKTDFEDLSEYVEYNGLPSISLSVQKRSDANSIAVSNVVMREIEKLKLSMPKDMKLEIASDSTNFIKASISTVVNSAYFGAILAIFVIFFFLRSFRATIIIGISIPIAIILTFCLMYFLNISINIMSLAGLALGIGMVVDCSIVVIDNIYKYRQKGAKLISSSILGAQEMMLPITSSTLTSICVFGPFLIFKSELGVYGDFFKDFSFTIVISLGVSLLVAIFLVPVLSSHYVGLYTSFQKNIKNAFIRRIDTFFASIYYFLEFLYINLLNIVLNHKLIFGLIVFFSFIGSLFLGLLLDVTTFARGKENSIVINLNFPNKTNLEYAKFYSNKFLEIVKSEAKGYKSIISTLNADRITFNILFPLKEESRDKLIQSIDYDAIKYKIMNRIGNLYPEFNIEPSSSNALGGGDAIKIKISGNDFEYIKDYGKILVSMLKKEIPELVNPRLSVNDFQLQIGVEIDRALAYNYGIDMNTILNELKANVNGVVAGQYVENGLNYDIVLKLDRMDVKNLKDLGKIFITSPSGVKIPFSSIATFEKTNKAESIYRENQALTIHLNAGISPNDNLTQVTAKVIDFINNKVPHKEGTVLKVEGEYDEFSNIMNQFKIIITMAIIVVFGIMASQFESFLKPFIIIFTIPLTAIGVVLIHFLAGEKLSIFAAIGMLMLVGVVVNTGIVLIDYTGLLIKRGFRLRESIIESCRSRLRPILMSSLTSIIGLIPMAFSSGSGNELLKPIAFTFIGGMTASTFLTLFFIPMLFEVFSNIVSSFKSRLKRVVPNLDVEKSFKINNSTKSSYDNLFEEDGD